MCVCVCVYVGLMEAVGRRMEEEKLRVAWVSGLIFVCVRVCVFVGRG